MAKDEAPSSWLQPSVLWALVLGMIAAWLYIAPIAFNQGALIGLLDQETAAALFTLSPLSASSR